MEIGAEQVCHDDFLDRTFSWSLIFCVAIAQPAAVEDVPSEGPWGKHHHIKVCCTRQDEFLSLTSVAVTHGLSPRAQHD